MALRRCLTRATLVAGKRVDFEQGTKVSLITEKAEEPGSYQHIINLPASVPGHSDCVDGRSMLLEKAHSSFAKPILSTLKAINSSTFTSSVFSFFPSRSYDYVSTIYKENGFP